MADPQGNEAVISELDVRIWMRDNDPDANNLIKDYEYTPEEIRTAMTLTVDYWNDTPPFIGTFFVSTFPWRSLMLRGTAANLLFIAAHRFRRNTLTYRTPGGAVNDQDKDDDYEGAGARLWDEFKRNVNRTKVAVNMEAGWGVIP